MKYLGHMVYPSGLKVLKPKVEAIDHKFPNQWKTLYGMLTKSWAISWFNIH
jgi:hypothetical protein